MKASDYIAAVLRHRGVKSVFEVSGGMITHMLDSIHRLGGIRVVSVHHEQAAAFAAEACGRMTGIPGVALATSGPGATNLLTGIGSCYFDSSPAVFLTGQVNREEQKGDRRIRQLGFQETDIVTMAAPVTKAAWKVRTAEELPSLLDGAFALAVEGRPGPVLLDIPMDVQRLDIQSDPAQRSAPGPAAAISPDTAAVESALELVLAARRPLVLAGGGIRSARAGVQFRRFARLLGIPVVNSWMAADVLPFDDELRLGMIGTYGNRWANVAMGNSDCCWSSEAVWTCARPAPILPRSPKAAPSSTWIANLRDDNRVSGCTAIQATLPEFLDVAIDAASRRTIPDRTAWQSEIQARRKQWPDTAELDGVPGINPNILMHALSARSNARELT